MYKITVLIPALMMLGAGNAVAFDAADGFGPSDANDNPIPRYQMATTVDRTAVTASIDRVTTSSVGFPVRSGRTAGWSAADGFGPSDANDSPVPRYQRVQ